MRETRHKCIECGNEFVYQHGGEKGYSYDPPFCGPYCHGFHTGKKVERNRQTDSAAAALAKAAAVMKGDDMSTPIDLPKIAQMLDSGWQVRMYKSQMGEYAVVTTHADLRRVRQALVALAARYPIAEFSTDEVIDMHSHDGGIITSDFTPEAALTRAAYKVFGEILGALP